MLKIVILLVILCVMFRWAFGKWPWDLAKGPTTRAQAIFKARKLLSVRENATREEISAAHKRQLAKVHPDRGGTAQQVHEADAARDLLFEELPEPVTKQDDPPSE